MYLNFVNICVYMHKKKTESIDIEQGLYQVTVEYFLSSPHPEKQTEEETETELSPLSIPPTPSLPSCGALLSSLHCYLCVAAAAVVLTDAVQTGSC